LGNFLFISLIIIYISQTLYKNDKKNRFFLITLIVIVLFDVLVLGFYFGSEKLLQRYSFLQNEINEYSPSSGVVSLSRGEMAKFAFIEFKKFMFFGYGGGGFENLLKINFQNLSTLFATHAHSDIMEFLGEFGLVGFTLITLSFLFSCANKNYFSFKNFLLFFLLIFILIFDFSFHIPIIQLLFVLLLSISYERSNKLEI
jgi:O-antigen ligase